MINKNIARKLAENTALRLISKAIEHAASQGRYYVGLFSKGSKDGLYETIVNHPDRDKIFKQLIDEGFKVDQTSSMIKISW